MPTAALPAAADRASLAAAERRTLERLISMAFAKLGDGLRGVWLFGSRARGESVAADSDVDLVVLATGGASRHGFASASSSGMLPAPRSSWRSPASVFARLGPTAEQARALVADAERFGAAVSKLID